MGPTARAEDQRASPKGLLSLHAPAVALLRHSAGLNPIRPAPETRQRHVGRRRLASLLLSLLGSPIGQSPVIGNTGQESALQRLAGDGSPVGGWNVWLERAAASLLRRLLTTGPADAPGTLGAEAGFG